MPPDAEQHVLTRIETLIRQHPRGLTTSEITRHLRANRNSTAKYLAILETSGTVEKNPVGASNVYTISRRVSAMNLLNCISELVLVLDSAGRIVMVNDAFLTFFGAGRESVEGSLLDAIPLDILRSIANRHMIGDMTGETDQVFALPVRGELSHFRVLGRPFIFADRKTGYALIIENLSDRKRAEEELVRSEANYRAVIEAQTDLICRRKSCGTITFANPAYHQFFKKEPGTLVGTAFYPVDLMPGIAAEPDSVKARILPFCNDVFEQCLLLENGEVRWIQWKNTSRMDSSGQLMEILSVGRDITHQREREREMLIGRCSIESSAHAAVIIDIMGRIVYTNRKFRELFGWESPEDIPGTLLDRFIPHDDPSSNICQLAQVMQETGRWDGRVRGRRMDNVILDLEMHASLMRNDRYFPIHGLILLTPWIPGRGSAENSRNHATTTGPLPRPRGVLIVDPAGKILQVNRDFLRITGYEDKREVLGRHAGELWNRDPGPDPKSSTAINTRSGQQKGLVRGRGGSQIPVMTCLNPLHDAGGSHLCSEVWIEPDMDRAMAGFAESADFFPFPTFAIDRNGNVLFWNRAMEAFTHAGRASLVGTNEYQKAFYPYHGTQPSIIDLVDQPLEAIRRIYPEIQKYDDMVVLERYIPDSGKGRGMYLLEKATPLVAPDGSPIGAIETIMDITEWKRSKELLDRTKEEIETGLNSRFRELVDRIGSTGRCEGDPVTAKQY